MLGALRLLAALRNRLRRLGRSLDCLRRYEIDCGVWSVRLIACGVWGVHLIACGVTKSIAAFGAFA